MSNKEKNMTTKNKKEKLSIGTLHTKLKKLEDDVEIQQKWIKITAIATVVIAVATTLYFLTTIIIVNIQHNNIELQSEYYNKTIRPFINIKDVKYTFYPKDSTWDLSLTATNLGSQPAKDLRSFYTIRKEENREIKLESNEIYYSSIFPDQEINIDFQRGYDDIGILRQYPYIHINLMFKDSGNKEYFYKEFGFLKELRILKDNRTLTNVNTIWVDFN